MFLNNFQRAPFWQGAGEGTAGQAPAESSTDAPAQPSLLSNAATPDAGAPSEIVPNASQTDQNAPQAKPAQGADPATKPGDTPAAAVEPVAAFDIAELTLPEGVALDEATGKAFTDLLNDAELTPQERGQKLFDLYTSNTTALQTAVQEAQVAAWTDLNTTWRTEVDALPEFKGKVEVELAAIKQVLVGPEFKAPKEFRGREPSRRPANAP